jgi:hypothetical protein
MGKEIVVAILAGLFVNIVTNKVTHSRKLSFAVMVAVFAAVMFAWDSDPNIARPDSGQTGQPPPDPLPPNTDVTSRWGAPPDSPYQTLSIGRGAGAASFFDGRVVIGYRGIDRGTPWLDVAVANGPREPIYLARGDHRDFWANGPFLRIGLEAFDANSATITVLLIR